jgi:hypothetical protein
MNCGNKFVIDKRPEEFILGIRNGVANGLIKINDDTWINPANISTIQLIKSPSLAVLR